MVINLLCTDIIKNTGDNIIKHKINSVEDVRKSRVQIVSFSRDIDGKNKELRKFLYEKMYKHYRVLRMESKAKMIIEGLFGRYVKQFEMLPPVIQKRYPGESKQRIVCDCIAGMTDRFAMDEYKRLFDPLEKV